MEPDLSFILGVVAIDDQGVLGHRTDSPMWGPLVQCESLLRTNDVGVALGSERVDGQIILTTVSGQQPIEPDLPALVIEYTRATRTDLWQGRASLEDGQPFQTFHLPKTLSVNHMEVVEGIAKFIDALATSSLSSTFELSIETEVLTGLFGKLLDRLTRIEELLDRSQSDNRQLLRYIDELTAERDLLRTQIADPNSKKVHWTTRSAVLSLLAISALLQGAASGRSLALDPAGGDDTQVVVNQSLVQCQTVIDMTIDQAGD